MSGSGSEVRNLEIRDFSSDGIIIGSPDSSTVRDCLIRRNGGNGISGAANRVRIERCTISGNNAAGIMVAGRAWTIRANSIGLDSAGTASLPNRGGGIAILASPGSSTDSILIGGYTAADGNVISGNGGAGVLISGSATTRVSVVLNTIGTAPSVRGPVPNSSDGVQITDGAQRCIVDMNLIFGNRGHGVRIAAGDGGIPRDNAVQSNTIGTDAPGGRALPNAGCGISVERSPGNRIGGLGAFYGNLVSGNMREGISVTGQECVGTTIQGNLVGVDRNANKPVPNGRNGIALTDAHNAVIGGPVTGAGNVVSGNTLNGLLLTGADSVILCGNIIGSNGTGAYPLPNSEHGISVRMSRQIRIGGAGCANILSHNGKTDIDADEASTMDSSGAANPQNVIVAASESEGSDVAVTLTTLRDTVSVGDTLVYMMDAMILGARPATVLRVTDSIPSGLSYISSGTTHGSTTCAAGIMICIIPALTKDDVATITVRTRVLKSGIIRLRATVSAAEHDGNPANNAGTRTVIAR
ncbi:MAG: right-handed parallel beta-helix repeat-containing protein [Ignavibacteria bacterium]|nr:right-handed parallel beta-helix repeat-containing protein [Ignavibacteria bacterium]